MSKWQTGGCHLSRLCAQEGSSDSSTIPTTEPTAGQAQGWAGPQGGEELCLLC